MNPVSPKKRKAPAQRVSLPKAGCKNMASTIIEVPQEDNHRPEDELTLLRSEIKHLDDEVKRLNGEVDRLDGEVKRFNDEVKRLNDEALHSKDEIDCLQREGNESKEGQEKTEGEVLEVRKAIKVVQKENSDFKDMVSSLENEKERLSKCMFDLDRFRSDEDMSFYTGFPNYSTFLAIFEFLNPGLEGENIRYSNSSDRNVPDNYYEFLHEEEDETEQENARKGRPKKLKTISEFFMVMCRLRRGFSLRHLANLYGIAKSTVSRSYTAWINFMYLKFGQINIWPSQEVVKDTMPEAFKIKFPSTRVIIDCTEVKCEMPSSLLLNSELFSSYKNHTTLKGLIGIAPNGSVTFISQLYTRSISDREIVIRSGFLVQNFNDGASVMADKWFTIEDLLPLGVSLNIPPFLGGNSQMAPTDVLKTQQIASLRIHVERAINRIKNYKIWNGVIPLSQFGLVNQMWCICAFLSNTQDPLISS